MFCKGPAKMQEKPAEFVVDEAQWEEFLKMLDRPEMEKARLRKLFAEEHVAQRKSYGVERP
jgi:uncharacterized protein (DUF1778 family)